MKTVALILAVLVSAETLFSCSLTDCCSSDHTELCGDYNQLDILDTESSHHSDKDKNKCSPFCGCCLHAADVEYLDVQFSTFEEHNTKKGFIYLAARIHAYQLNIWQPPKSS